MDMTKKVLRITAAAKYVGVCINTLRRWDASGRLKSHRTTVGYRYYYEHELDDFLRNAPRVNPLKYISLNKKHERGFGNVG